MKKLIVVAIALSGCVPQEFFVKNNVTYDRYERDSLACATKVTQQVPTNTQVGWAPYVGVYSSDTNAPLRAANFELCMRDKGYQKVQVPMCSGDQTAALATGFGSDARRAQRMKVKSNSCFVMNSKGEQLLYTPSGG